GVVSASPVPMARASSTRPQIPDRCIRERYGPTVTRAIRRRAAPRNRRSGAGGYPMLAEGDEGCGHCNPDQGSHRRGSKGLERQRKTPGALWDFGRFVRENGEGGIRTRGRV